MHTQQPFLSRDLEDHWEEESWNHIEHLHRTSQFIMSPLRGLGLPFFFLLQ